MIDDVKLAEFNDKLGNTNWSELEGIDNVNIDYNNFIERFVSIYNDCFPVKKNHQNC